MINPEREIHGQASFFDVTRGLADEECLILHRNKVNFLHTTMPDITVPVHYEGLNYLTDTYQSLHRGRLLTEEFYTTAKMMLDNKDLVNSLEYPLLTVIDDATGTKVTEEVNVAHLIQDELLPVYSLPVRSKVGGEMIGLGMNTLIKGMARKIGINPIGAVVSEGRSVHTIEDEAEAYTWNHLPPDREAGAQEKKFDPRGKVALVVLQRDIMAQFADIKNDRRVTDRKDDRVEVQIRLTSQPDLQTLTLSLIDSVEASGHQLLYSQRTIQTGEVGSILDIVDHNLEYIDTLSAEPTLDMAIHNAYLAFSSR